MADNDDLLDYEDEEQPEQAVVDGSGDVAPAKKEVKGNYVSIHSSGFRDFLLKPEILRAIIDCGFEHPSEVQHECIPQAVLGMDILCQAKSGMGKTAVFVLATLQQLEATENQVYVLVMCHTRELAFQISKEYERFSKYMPQIKVGVFFGGLPIQKDEEVLKNNCPHIVVGTPGRIMALVRNKKLNLKHLKHFVLDECDKMLELLDMRRDVQEIFRNTPHSKQVMMFSATLSRDIRPVCKKFMQDVIASPFFPLSYFHYWLDLPFGRTISTKWNYSSSPIHCLSLLCSNPLAAHFLVSSSYLLACSNILDIFAFVSCLFYLYYLSVYVKELQREYIAASSRFSCLSGVYSL